MITAEDLQAARKAIRSAGGTLSRRKLAAELGIGEKKARNILRRLCAVEDPESFEKKSWSGDQVDCEKGSKESISNEAELFEFFGLDPDSFDIIEWSQERKWWDFAAKDDETGKIESKRLHGYRVKGRFRRNRERETTVRLADQLREDRRQARLPEPRFVASKGFRGRFEVEIDAPDSHVGMLAWPEETGWGAWDVDIALETLEKAIAALLARIPAEKYDRVVIPVGNDLSHVNSGKNTTFNGTPVDVDTRFAKYYKRLRDFKIGIIEKIRADVAPVKVIWVAGNHDRESSFHLVDSIECWFHGDKYVDVDCTAKATKYHRFGRSLVGYHHGDGGKAAVNRIIAAMPRERPKDWAETRHWEFRLGHLHHNEVYETNGIVARRFASLAPADAWHASLGYVGNQRGAQAIVTHVDEGVVSIANYRIPEVLERA